MVRMVLKLWKLTLEPYQSFSEDDAPAPSFQKPVGVAEKARAALETPGRDLSDEV